MLRGAGAYASSSPEKMLKIRCSLGRFGVYFVCFDHCMLYLAHEEIFKNMLQLKHFGVLQSKKNISAPPPPL